MALDYNALKSEIETDPKALGLAPFVEAGNDVAVANALNSTTGPGATSVNLAFLTRDEFLKGVRGAYTALPAKDTATQSKWDRILNAINSGDGVTVDATTMGLLGMAVQDGVLQQTDVDALTARAGSRAEVLFGPGITISPTDVSFALRGTR